MTSGASLNINENKLTLSGVLDFDSILAVDAQGQTWINTVSTDDLMLDLSAVTYSSSAGIALLLGWLRAAEKRNKKLTILHLPNTMLALAKVGGLGDLFK